MKKQKMGYEPRPKQRRAAKAIIENSLKENPLPKSEVLATVGYSKNVQNSPQIVLGSEGFKTALIETGLLDALKKQGINPQKIAKKIDLLLEAKDHRKRDDYNAIDKGLKHATAIYGILPDKPPDGGKATYNFIFSAPVQDKIKQMEDEIKNLLTNSYVEAPQENVEAKPEEPGDSEQVDGGGN